MRHILIDENKENEIISELISEAFYPNADKVLFIKNYIDKNFQRQNLDDIDTNGYPCISPSVVMMSCSGQPLKTMQPKEFLLFLDDKFLLLVYLYRMVFPFLLTLLVLNHPIFLIL